MASKLIRLLDETLVEVEVSDREAKEVAGGVADRVKGSFDKIGSIQGHVCRGDRGRTWASVYRGFKMV